MGTFTISYPLPWEMERAKIDVLGMKKPERVGDDLPKGLLEVDDDQGIVYRNEKPEFDEDGNQTNEVSIVFYCCS